MSDGATNDEILLAACKQDNPDLLNSVLSDSKTNLNARDGVGNTGLHYAANCGSLDCLRMLRKANPNIQNLIEGDTPLHKACSYQEPHQAFKMAELLVEYGSDPRTKNRMGQRPIDLVSFSLKELRTLLLQATLAINMAPPKNDIEESEDENYDSD
ncbi:hypothetical protein BB559_006203 [Furculomyces boomerangus]|uniref:Uncharacterized protein n=2 Tax=Harpellales TaxID=61421 RepID=A0A2T9Y484_9FUNG|nr:hypothetical protein BB559_006203 [Furculomyces boomerangus]PVZ97186.1 hypothetical protein BB558_006865 [Smittium angustum]PWA02218.1 hypothetical protein BB558_001645 [Smittium angustum]